MANTLDRHGAARKQNQNAFGHGTKYRWQTVSSIVLEAIVSCLPYMLWCPVLLQLPAQQHYLSAEYK